MSSAHRTGAVRPLHGPPPGEDALLLSTRNRETYSSAPISSATVRDVLAALDAEQITLQLKGRVTGPAGTSR